MAGGAPRRPDEGHAGLRRSLLSWYDRNRRDLPWRRSKDPYRIWVSEVMLQQTTVKTVLPYYEAFLARFPTLTALAEEPIDEVLAAWSGLGYYHRARNLHRGAQHVAERHAGHFPQTLEAALAVPGVGLYTASAVLSIAYGLPLPVVDGNVRRVLSRLLALRGPAYRKDGAYYNRAEELLDADAPGRLEPGADGARRDGLPAAQARLSRLPAAPALRGARARPGRRAARDPRAAGAGGRDGAGGARRARRPRAAGAASGGPAARPPLGGARRPRSTRAAAPTSRGRSRSATACTWSRGRSRCGRATPSPTGGSRSRATGRACRPPLPDDPERFLWARPDEVARLPVASSTRKLLRGLALPQLPLELPS